MHRVHIQFGGVFGAQLCVRAPQIEGGVGEDVSNVADGPDKRGVPVGHSRREQNQIGVLCPQAGFKRLLADAEMIVFSADRLVGVRFRYFNTINLKSTVAFFLSVRFLYAVDQLDAIALIP